MRSRVTLGKYIIYCVLVSLLVMILTSAFMGFMSFNMDYRIIIGISVGTNLLLYLIYLYPIVGIILAALIPSASAAYYFINSSSFTRIVQSGWNIITECFIWFSGYMFAVPGINSLYMNIITALFIILITIALFFLITVKKYVVFSLIAGAVALSFMWLFRYDNALDYIQKYVFICFITYGFVNYDCRETGWKLKRDKYSKTIIIGWMASTLIAMALVFLVTDMLPNNINAVNFQWVNENVFSKFSSINFRDFGNMSKGELSDRFSISSMGFQEGPSKLGGAVRLSNRLLLKVQVDGKIDTPIYLRGAVKNFYSGTMWTKTGSLLSYPGNNNSILNHLLVNDSMVKESEDVAITVYPQSISTTSLFSIWKPHRVESDVDSYTYYNDGEIYLQNSKIGIKQYKITSSVPKIYSDELKNAPKLMDARNTMYQYLELPDSLPERVRSLTLQITDKYDNDYDKAVAIQDYLRSTYPYTLDTSTVPDGRDFVDYFLFEEKKGYCTYFASAMVLMSRISGIPSRYVEGFIINSSDTDESGIYKVTSDRAHAWVELNFDKYGWFRFEPTSAYQAADYEMPATTDDAAYNPEDSEEVANIPLPGRNKDLEKDTGDTGEMNGTKAIPWEIYTAGIISLIIILKLGFKAYYREAGVRKADKLSGKEAAAEYFSFLEKKLKAGGFERPAGETPSEFAKRISESLSRYGIDIIDVINSFGSVRFGNNKLDVELRDKFKNTIKIADKLIRARRGFIRYIAMKYII